MKYLYKPSAKMQTKKFEVYILILAIVNYRKWLDASPPSKCGLAPGITRPSLSRYRKIAKQSINQLLTTDCRVAGFERSQVLQALRNEAAFFCEYNYHPKIHLNSDFKFE